MYMPPKIVILLDFKDVDNDNPDVVDKRSYNLLHKIVRKHSIKVIMRYVEISSSSRYGKEFYQERRLRTVLYTDLIEKLDYEIGESKKVTNKHPRNKLYTRDLLHVRNILSEYTPSVILT